MNHLILLDLHSTEKLRLVEDRWDDLASITEAVPIHEWQTQELACRGANLTSSPASAHSCLRAAREVKCRIHSRDGQQIDGRSRSKVGQM